MIAISFFIESSSDADNEDSRNILDKFDFGSDETLHESYLPFSLC